MVCKCCKFATKTAAHYLHIFFRLVCDCLKPKERSEGTTARVCCYVLGIHGCVRRFAHPPGQRFAGRKNTWVRRPTHTHTDARSKHRFAHIHTHTHRSEHRSAHTHTLSQTRLRTVSTQRQKPAPSHTLAPTHMHTNTFAHIHAGAHPLTHREPHGPTHMQGDSHSRRRDQKRRRWCLLCAWPSWMRPLQAA